MLQLRQKKMRSTERFITKLLRALRYSYCCSCTADRSPPTGAFTTTFFALHNYQLRLFVRLLATSLGKRFEDGDNFTTHAAGQHYIELTGEMQGRNALQAV